jgi:hypothetical protein
LARPDVQVSLIPIMIVLYATLLPREVAFFAGGLAFYSDRLALIIALPWVLYKLFKGAIRFVLPDFLVVLAGIWMVVALAANYGITKGFISGGSQALDATVGYYLARISFRSLTAIRRALIVFSPGLAIVGASIMVESISHQPIVQPLAEALFGRLPAFASAGDVGTALQEGGGVRMGLMRARGPFSHPILAGVHLASMGALYGMSGIRGWPAWCGRFASLCSIFTVSSAAFAALMINYLAMFFDTVQRRFRELSWRLALTVFGGGLLVMQLTTNIGAIGFVQRYLVFDSSTAFFRELIWTYGSASVRKHPWFGVGFEDYERPVWMVTTSIDAHWLLLAVRFGLVPAVALIWATVMAISALAKASVHVSYVNQRFYRGIAISLTGFALMMFTVTLWGSALSWFNLLLGTCVACAQRAYSLGYQPPIVSDAKRGVPRSRAGRNFALGN